MNMDIQSAKIMTAEQIIKEGIFDIYGADTWAIVFQVGKDFANAFYAYMKDHAEKVFEPQWLLTECDQQEDLMQHTVFSKDGHIWEFGEQGELVMLGDNDFDEEDEVPADAWIRPVATMKAVLHSMA